MYFRVQRGLFCFVPLTEVLSMSEAVVIRVIIHERQIPCFPPNALLTSKVL